MFDVSSEREAKGLALFERCAGRVDCVAPDPRDEADPFGHRDRTPRIQEVEEMRRLECGLDGRDHQRRLVLETALCLDSQSSKWRLSISTSATSKP